ncbi:MAG TPA: AMP-binding protein [Acidimicrobiales bacterium]|nr:AMP-binding protein [Acidimicrobiales bacterium]
MSGDVWPVEPAPRFDDGTLWRLIERRAAETPHAQMLVDESGRTLTFAEYRDAAERAAAGLAALGVHTGTVVSWQLPTWIESVVLVAALARLGAVQNPLVPIYREREVRFCAHQTRAELLVVPSVWRGFDYAAMATRIAEDLAHVRVLVADRALPEGDPAALPPPPPVPASVAAAPVRWIYYTSGSTADPKGAMHTDPGLAAAAIAFLERIELTADDRVALVFPFTHIGGSNFLISGLLAGCTYICVEIFDPVATVDVLAREGVTIAGAGTPFHLAYLDVQRARSTEPIFPRLRACNGGGGPKPAGLHYDVKRELGGVGIVSGYGLTECPVLAMNDLHSDDDAMARSEGRPAPGVEIRIVGLDGRPCGPGEEGEIRAKAPQMLRGYVDAALDVDAFDDDGFFHTGDLGYRLGGGHVVVSGRLKDIIIRKGENISAKEVEDLLYLHPKVAEVAVVGLPDPDLGERCCAVVVPRDARDPLHFDEMVSYLRDGGLMMQKIPEQLEISAGLPRAPAGKVLKQDLKRQLAGSAP